MTARDVPNPSSGSESSQTPRSRSKSSRRSRRGARPQRQRWLWLALFSLVTLASASLWLVPRFAARSRELGQRALEQLPNVFTGAELDALSNAITEMDVARAQSLLAEHQGAMLSVEQAQRLALERARLSLYVGDCDSAQAILATLPPESPATKSLLEVAAPCAGAVAASRVIEDVERGIWLRLQDGDDEPLAHYIVEVADRAREAVRADLGVELPRPLRIDVVRDLFSLSAVSGLPLEAAETTGTVAVARWGRVTLLSPRAARHGYPWEDTMAHELVHLALSRATRDFAPLWLQEGVAKRQEQRWREPRPFDDEDGHDIVARRALDTGASVGVNNLGPSIAMLPSADAASIAFSEVTSFINYWIEQNGRAAFQLLLADLRGLSSRDPDPALVTVSGHTLEQWIARWQVHLRTLELPQAEEDTAEQPSADLRNIKLGDLLLGGQHFQAAARHFAQAREAAPRASALRFRESQAELGAGHPERARKMLGQLADIDSPHAGWFALHGRFAHEAAEAAEAERSSRMALSLDPWSEVVACEGYAESLLGAEPWQLPEPADPARRVLCAKARARPPVQ